MSELPGPQETPNTSVPMPDPSDTAGMDESMMRELEGITEADMAALASTPTPTTVIPERGTEITGRVIGTGSDGLFLDVGLRAQAFVPTAQFEEGGVPETGAEVELVVDRFDSSADLLHAHRKGAVVAASDLDLITRGTLLEGNVSGMVKGGLEVQFGSLRAFMPASHADLVRVKDISVLLGQRVRCEVIEVDPRNKNLIVSRRNALKKEQEEQRQTLLAEIKPGQVRKGVVVNLTDYGAFVDLGGLHGLVHVSDMSWTPVGKPSDLLQPGDEVSVRILKINQERNRISLGLKQATPDPWTNVETEWPVGTKIKARVVKLADFGAFAEVTEGVQGLIPMSEMSWNHRPAKTRDVVDVGQMVDVVVISVDAKRRRMGLSIKQLGEDPWSSIADAYPPDSIVTGKVTKLLDFGALVELHAGVEGMIHISELSEHRVPSPGDVVSVGEEVSVKVLSVDTKKRKIALSLKATTADTAVADTDAPVLKPAKPKKPRRGGLDSHFEW